VSRQTKVGLVVAAVAGVVFVGLSIALRVQLVGGGASTAVAPARPEPARQDLGLGVPVDRRPPAVRLLDARGRPTSLRSFRGRWVVVAPSMTLCHEVCPLTTAALLRLRRLMAAAGAGRRFVAIEVTVDPWRDTPRRLRAYRRMTGADFPLLTGSVGAVRRLMGFLGVNFERVRADDPPARDWMTGRPERFDVEHTDGAFVFDPGGVERLAVPGMPAVGGRIKAPLGRLLDEDGRKNLHRPAPGWSAVGLARRLESMMDLGERGAGARAGPARGDAPADRSRRPADGDLVVDQSLADALGSARGRPAVVNVWASWCPPCREELPLLAAAAPRFAGRIAFLGADLEDDAGAARALLARTGVDYPSYPTDAAELGDLLAPVQGTPVTFFLGPGGEVVDEHIGAYRSAAQLDADLLRHAAPP
jgi:cytochrome oxidase Cu insertion factor (SCO1/SenC/PrrC family)/thiol-disulfide isomerase/thioredoxin